MTPIDFEIYGRLYRRDIVGDKINVIRVHKKCLRGFSYILLTVFAVKKQCWADIIWQLTTRCTANNNMTTFIEHKIIWSAAVKPN